MLLLTARGKLRYGKTDSYIAPVNEVITIGTKKKQGLRLPLQKLTILVKIPEQSQPSRPSLHRARSLASPPSGPSAPASLRNPVNLASLLTGKTRTQLKKLKLTEG